MELLNVTLNPNDMGSGFTLSNGNLTISNIAVNAIRATHGKIKGKWYWEVKSNAGDVRFALGISNKSFPLPDFNFNQLTNNWRGFFFVNGNKLPENIVYGSSSTVGTVIGVALDLDNGTLEFYKNGVSMGISHTNVKELGEVYPTMGATATPSKTVTFNFGATPFAYNIPSGFLAYNSEPSHKILISSEDEYFSIRHSSETATPKMTSNTAPSGRAFASNALSTNTEPWVAFDKADSNTYASANNSGGVGYLGYEFVSPVSINKYVLRSGNLSRDSFPKDWTFEGSNDGTNWTILDTQVNQVQAGLAYADVGEYMVDINKVNKYKMYRLNWTANNGYAYTSVGELRLYEVDSLLKLPNQSEQTFLNHGLNKDTSIDLTTSKLIERRYIVQDSTQLGSGKVFKQKIDTSNILIKNVLI